jgi:agmatinase
MKYDKINAMITTIQPSKSFNANDLNSLQAGSTVLLGIPFDEYSSFLKGPADAPDEIRKALNSPSSNLFTENRIDLGSESRLSDLGNINIDDYPTDIQHAVSMCLEKDLKVVSLGGDHAVTYPIIKAYSAKYAHLNILHFDAHPDLYDSLDGNRYSHACPFARIMEEKLVHRLVQIGIRTMNSHQKEQANRFKVEVIEMNHWKSAKESFKLYFNGPVYISLDLDVLDPAFAPGVSHYEPGGMSTREIIDIIQSIDAPIIGADIVELNPIRDLNGMTAMVAAKFLKEILAKLLT